MTICKLFDTKNSYAKEKGKNIYMSTSLYTDEKCETSSNKFFFGLFVYIVISIGCL